jgi:hypothetical protein
MTAIVLLVYRHMPQSKRVDGFPELSALLAGRDALVSYSPLPEEPVPPPFSGAVFLVPKSREADPGSVARDACKLSGRVAILIPGRTFDRTGTRHGRGGGWYDRLLPLLPEEWIRIGLCFSRNLSTETLPRQPWDAPVDYVAVMDLPEPLVVTHARDTLA